MQFLQLQTNCCWTTTCQLSYLNKIQGVKKGISNCLLNDSELGKTTTLLSANFVLFKVLNFLNWVKLHSALEFDRAIGRIFSNKIVDHSPHKNIRKPNINSEKDVNLL